MNYIFTVKNQLITSSQDYIVADSVNFCEVTFQFDAEWDGYTKTVLFSNLTKQVEKSVLLDATNTCYIPWEVLRGLGVMNVYVRGDKDSSIATVAKMCCPIPIYKSGASADVDFENIPTPDIYHQILDRLQLVETGGMTAEQFNALLVDNEEFQQVASRSNMNAADIANMTTQIGEIDKGVAILDNQVQGIAANLGTQITALEQTNATVSKNTEAIESNSTNIKNAQSAINQLMDGQNDLTARVTTAEDKIDVLEDKVADLEAGGGGGGGDPGTPSEEFKELKKQVEKNTIDIASNSQDISQALTETSANKSSIVTLEGNVNDLESSDATQNTNISTLQTQVSTNTADIATLQQQIEDISSVAGVHSAKVLFTGRANTVGNDYTLADSVTDFDYLYCTLNWWNDDTGYTGNTSVWIKTQEITLDGQKSFVETMTIHSNGTVYQQDFIYSFKNSTTLHCVDMYQPDTGTMLGITKVIGVKFLKAEDIDAAKLQELEDRIETLETSDATQNTEISTLKTQVQNLQDAINQLELGGAQTVQKTVFEGVAQNVGTYNFTERIATYNYLVIEGYSANPGQPSYFCELVSIPTLLPQRNWWWERDFSFLKADNTITHSIIALTFDSAGLSFNVAFNRTDTPQETSNAKTNAIIKMTALKFVSAEDYTDLQTQVATNTSDIASIKQKDTEQDTTLDSLATDIDDLAEQIKNLPGSGGANVSQTVLYENTTNALLPIGLENAITLNDAITNYDYIYISASTAQFEDRIANSVGAVFNPLDITGYNLSVPFSITTNSGAGTGLHNRFINLAFNSPTSFFISAAASSIETPATYLTIRRIIGLKLTQVKNEWITNISNIYSEEEKQIGGWINGKPLYQKTVVFDIPAGTVSDRRQARVLLSGENDNMEAPFIVGGFVQSPGERRWPLNMAAPLKTATVPYYVFTEISIQPSEGSSLWYAFCNLAPELLYTQPFTGCITIQYTKTTDAVDSFNPELADYPTDQEVATEVANILS